MADRSPVKRRRGPPRSKYHEMVVRLHRQGQRPADIARALKLTRQWVSAILKEAGVDSFAEARRRRQQVDAEFQAKWNAAPDLVTAAKRLGLTPGGTRALASGVRCRGVLLKRFPRASRPNKAPAIVALHRQGLTAQQIIRRGVADRSTVYTVLKQFKPAGSNAGRVWTVAEDALLANMSDAEVAARTGRKVKAVTARRRLLRKA